MKALSSPETFPVVYHTGRFVPAREATVSIFDRAVLYGDGLFETVCISNGTPLRWRQHFDRLQQGASFLRIPLDPSADELREVAIELARRNLAPSATLRLTLTRGVGRRGYSPAGASSPAVLMSLHQAPAVDRNAPAQWRLVTSTIRLAPGDPLARFKSCNRLPYVLARQEADAADAHEALLLNSRNEVAECSAANIFWLSAGRICTPPLHCGILPGITRAHVIRLAHDLGVHTCETVSAPECLLAAEAVFLTFTTHGLVEVISLDGTPISRSPLVRTLHTAHWAGELSTPPPPTPAP